MAKPFLFQNLLQYIVVIIICSGYKATGKFIQSGSQVSLPMWIKSDKLSSIESVQWNLVWNKL